MYVCLENRTSNHFKFPVELKTIQVQNDPFSALKVDKEFIFDK